MPVAALAGSCLQNLGFNFSVTVSSQLRFKVVFVRWSLQLLRIPRISRCLWRQANRASPRDRDAYAATMTSPRVSTKKDPCETFACGPDWPVRVRQGGPT